MDEPLFYPTYRSEAFAEDLEPPDTAPAGPPRWNLFLTAVALTVGAWLASGSLPV